MNKSVVGIDLGTSAVKVIQRYKDGNVVTSKANYDEISPKGWWIAICEALSQIALEDVEAIGLSSQVGTYIVNGKDVISWNQSAGAEEVAEVRETYKIDVFMREISMPHPSLVSYPIPRFKYIKKHFENVEKVCMPKDFICEILTGNWVTDPYSWRGLANLETKKYSEYFLKELGFESSQLPKMIDYKEIAGYTKEIQMGDKVMPAGIPVYVGLNDYYASLLGMGIENAGDAFDISGTSEHLGIIEKTVCIDTKMVSGPYLNENVHYGVTNSSGASLAFGLKFHESGKVDLASVSKHNPPIFLPYLNGERAPIWDGNAKGVWFGLGGDHTKEDLFYSIMEGVVFSIYHIYESMGCPEVKFLKLAGGAAVNPELNFLKAEMFGVPAGILAEKDTSALGAAMIAAIGNGWYSDNADAIADICKITEYVNPTGEYREWLLKRFEIYKAIYPAVKEQFLKLKEM